MSSAGVRGTLIGWLVRLHQTLPGSCLKYQAVWGERRCEEH